MLPATNVVPFRDAGSFDLNCFSGVQLGRDTSGNFALSFEGLAVKTNDGRFVVPRFREGAAIPGVGDVRLIDVTCFTFGVDPYVFRWPVQDIRRGDLIVTSDSPFSVLLVIEVVREDGDDGEVVQVRGLVPGTQEIIRYVPPQNALGFRYFVKVFSIFDTLDEDDDDEGGDFESLWPILLCCCRGGQGSVNENLLPLLLSSYGGGRRRRGRHWRQLLILLACGGGGDAQLNPLLTAWAFAGNSPFGGGRRSRRGGEERYGAVERSAAAEGPGAVASPGGGGGGEASGGGESPGAGENPGGGEGHGGRRNRR